MPTIGDQVDSSGLDIKFDVYSWDSVVAVCVSFLFFILFFIGQAMDFNRVLKDFGVAENVISRAKMLYVYFIGYIIFIIKFVISMFTFVLIVMIITVIISSFVSVITLKSPDGNVSSLINSASEHLENLGVSMMQNIVDSLVATGKYILAFIALKQFFAVYLVAIPLFLVVFYLLYAWILYKPKNMENDKENVNKMMNTQHTYFFFIFASLAFMAIIYIIYTYVIQLELPKKA